MSLKDIRRALHAHADPQKALHCMKFFKTGKGQYGEGDKFLGLTVPAQRAIAKQFPDLSLDDIQALLNSPWHEERLTALMILVMQYQNSGSQNAGRGRRDVALQGAGCQGAGFQDAGIRGDQSTGAQTQEAIYKFYLKNAARINNWDLVDVSAHHIVGARVHATADMSVLKRLAKSKLLWERRIAMVACLYHIRLGHHEPAVTVAAMLLDDKEDLMHKAAGWMLREVGKRASQQELERFLKTHRHKMPRTMLRYAIEHFPPNRRKEYLAA